MFWQDEANFELAVGKAFSAMPFDQGKTALGNLVIRMAWDWEHLRCGKAQADGVPCQDGALDCATCLGWVSALEVLAEAPLCWRSALFEMAGRSC